MGADCGSDHELLIAKFRLKLNSFRYDLNQVLYDYTVEERNRFKGLGLIDRVPDELWLERWTGNRDQNHPQEKKCKKSKIAV